MYYRIVRTCNVGDKFYRTRGNSRTNRESSRGRIGVSKVSNSSGHGRLVTSRGRSTEQLVPRQTRRVGPSFAISMIYGRFTRCRINPRTRRNDEKSREILTHIRTAVVAVLFMLSDVRHIALRVTSHPRLRATVTSRCFLDAFENLLVG